METKKYDILLSFETNHFPVPENGIGHEPVGLPGPAFNRSPGEYPSVLQPSDLPNGYGRVGTTNTYIDGFFEIAKHIKILWKEIHNNDSLDLRIAVGNITFNMINASKNDGDIEGFNSWLEFDEDGYAYYDVWSEKSISKPNNPRGNKIDTKGKGISKERLAEIKKEGQQAVRDFNTRKMIKEFSDRAEKWGDNNPPIYDYKDVPATSGGSSSGGGGSTPKKIKPKHIV